MELILKDYESEMSDSVSVVEDLREKVSELESENRRLRLVGPRDEGAVVGDNCVPYHTPKKQRIQSQNLDSEILPSTTTTTMTEGRLKIRLRHQSSYFVKDRSDSFTLPTPPEQVLTVVCDRDRNNPASALISLEPVLHSKVEHSPSPRETASINTQTTLPSHVDVLMTDLSDLHSQLRLKIETITSLKSCRDSLQSEVARLWNQNSNTVSLMEFKRLRAENEGLRKRLRELDEKLRLKDLDPVILNVVKKASTNTPTKRKYNKS